jgi:hypothetical protein
MSQEGLLRTLLYQALIKSEHLITKLFPHRLEALILFGADVAFDEPWKWAELLRAFKLTLREITKAKENKPSGKVAIFIDGLDEYHGMSERLIELIQSFLQPNVKACVSSRPWIVFEDAFESSPSLRLEELTAMDMRIYAKSRFSSNKGFRVL